MKNDVCLLSILLFIFFSFSPVRLLQGTHFSFSSGPNVMLGYLNNPKATADTIDSEGFLHTGDVAVVDKDGFYYIVDRVKELIKVYQPI